VAAVQPAYEDLTARARIRDAALRLFTERGIDATTVRDIAKEAGVSPGLLRHHFGSKDALRDACDQHALALLMDLKQRAVLQGEISNPGFMVAMHPTVLMLMRYLSRSMVDGSPAAAALFDQMVDLGEAWITTNYPGLYEDPRAVSAVIAGTQTGLLVMQDHVSRALGADMLSAKGHSRVGKALIDLYSRPMPSEELAEQAHAAYDRLDNEGARS
jgi:TetR/AcrR family transcriptional regulator, regulator of cefoperazone and chloramphenicol sensitivity